jgi:hypothetical protein
VYGQIAAVRRDRVSAHLDGLEYIERSRWRVSHSAVDLHPSLVNENLQQKHVLGHWFKLHE